jgi:putative transposase
MQGMGIEAVYRRPRTSTPAPGHKIFPYLLRGMNINWANQVWAREPLTMHKLFNQTRPR